MLGKQDAIMADARAFMKSRIILTAAELDLFTQLAVKPRKAKDLADDLRLNERALIRLLDSLAAFGLLSKKDGQYSVSGQGAYYSSHHPETVLPMVRHLNFLWENWSDLTETAQKGENRDRKPGIQMDEENWKSFIGAMHVVGRHLSEQIADDYDASRFHRLLDVGGGSGTYTIAFLKKNPGMNAVIFDLERVIPLARERLHAEGYLTRVELVSGDFYNDKLPAGCDLALLSAIIHQNSPDENVNLYRKIWEALEPGGVILIRDYMMDETRTSPPPGALFAVNMLVATQGGNTYTYAETKEALEQAGFGNVRLARQGQGMDSLVDATKP